MDLVLDQGEFERSRMSLPKFYVRLINILSGFFDFVGTD